MEEQRLGLSDAVHKDKVVEDLGAGDQVGGVIRWVWLSCGKSH